MFSRIFSRKILSLKDAWGYLSAGLPKPQNKTDQTFILVKHNLSTHAREILFQLTDSQNAFEGIEKENQSGEEAKTVAEIISRLKELIQYGNQLKTHYNSK